MYTFTLFVAITVNGFTSYALIPMKDLQECARFESDVYSMMSNKNRGAYRLRTMCAPATPEQQVPKTPIGPSAPGNADKPT